MEFKHNTKQRTKTIQGLRSFKDTLPKKIKKILNKKGHIYSETLENWRYIVGNELFEVCYPKSFKNSNKFGVSTLQIMVKRGHEIDLEYSKKVIMDKMNSFFGYSVVEKLKFISFSDDQNILSNDVEYNNSDDTRDENDNEETEASLDSEYDIDEYKLDEQLIDSESDQKNNEQVIQKKSINDFILV